MGFSIINHLFLDATVYGNPHIFVCFCPSQRYQTGHATSTTVMAQIFRRIGARRRELLGAEYSIQIQIVIPLAIFGRVEILKVVSNTGAWMIEKE